MRQSRKPVKPEPGDKDTFYLALAIVVGILIAGFVLALLNLAI